MMLYIVFYRLRGIQSSEIDNIFQKIHVTVGYTGAVFTYSQVQGVWTQQQAIVPDYYGSSFGTCVAYSRDGTMFVGAISYGKQVHTSAYNDS